MDKNTPAQQTDGRSAKEWLALSQTLSRDLNITTKDFEESLNQLLTSAAKRTGVDALAVWTIDDEIPSLSIDFSVGLSERFCRYFNHTDRIRVGRGMIGAAIERNETQAIASAKNLSYLGTPRWQEFFEEEGFAAIIAVPLKVADHPIGVLTALTKADHPFTSSEWLFFEILGNQIALAIENASRHRSIQENSEELEGQIEKLTNLQDAFQSINRYLNESLDQALSYLAQYIEETFGGRGVAIYQSEAKNQALRLVASHNLPELYTATAEERPLAISANDTLITRAFTEQKAQFSSRVFTDPRIEKHWTTLLADSELTAETAYPLTAEDRALGVLVVYYDHLHSYNDEEISVLGAFSQFLGILLENQSIFASLVSEKQKTQAIVYSLQDGLIVYDLAGAITDINPRGVEILGAEKDTLLSFSSESCADPKEPWRKNMCDTSTLPIPDYETREIELPHPEQQIIAVTQVPLFQENRQKIGSIRILHDVTEERLAERLKSNFVSTAAHQLRTPMTGMRWAINELKSESSGTLSDAQKEVLGKLEETTDFVISLVNDLLSASRVESGKLTYDFKEKDVVPLIESILEKLSISIEEKELSITFDKPETPLPTVSIDETNFSIALQNIIDNAIKYTPKGGSATISVSQKDGMLSIAVTDSGIGISKEDQRFLFNKFFRAKNAVRIETDGSGLGLFLAKNVIEDHHGTLTVESAEGKGSTFTISIPTDEKRKPTNTESPSDENGDK